MNSGRGWHIQFLCSGPRTGASGENVSPPTTLWPSKKVKHGQAFLKFIFLNEPIAGTPRRAIKNSFFTYGPCKTICSICFPSTAFELRRIERQDDHSSGDHQRWANKYCFGTFFLTTLKSSKSQLNQRQNQVIIPQPWISREISFLSKTNAKPAKALWREEAFAALYFEIRQCVVPHAVICRYFHQISEI